jgi:hypothetical protein
VQVQREQVVAQLNALSRPYVAQIVSTRTESTERLENFDRTRAYVEERFTANDEDKLTAATLQNEKKKLDEKLKQLAEKYQAAEDGGAKLEDFKLLVEAVVNTNWHDAEKKTHTFFGVVVGSWLRKIVTGNRQDQFPQSLIHAATTIANKSQAAYHALRAIIPCFPSLRTLRRTNDCGHKETGFDAAGLQKMVATAYLNPITMAAIASGKGLIGVLNTDDANLLRGNTINKTTQEVTGCCDDMNFEYLFPENEAPPDGNDDSDYAILQEMQADYVAQWYWTSLDDNLNFPIGHYFVKQSDELRVHRQKMWLLEGMNYLHACGFRTWAIVADSGSVNVALRKLFTMSQGSATPEVKESIAERTNGTPNCAKSHRGQDNGTPMQTRASTGASEATISATPLPTSSEGPSPPMPSQSTSTSPSETVTPTAATSTPPPPAPTSTPARIDPEVEMFSVPHPIEPAPMRLFFLPDVEHLLKAMRNALYASRPEIKKKSDAKSGENDEDDNSGRKIWVQVTVSGTKKWQLATWRHIDQLLEWDTANNKAAAVVYGLTLAATKLDSWSKMRMKLLFDDVINMRVADGLLKAYADIRSKAETRPDGTTIKGPTYMSNPKATYTIVRDIAYISLVTRPNMYGHHWGYRTSTDKRLVELETIYKEWDDNRQQWREYKLASMSEKDKKSAKLYLEGFADQTMDAFKCFVYGFKGLMQQYEREFPGTRRAINVPVKCGWKATSALHGSRVHEHT